MRVLLTGGGGFLGSYVTRRLVRTGHQVAAVLRPQTDPWRIADLLPQVTRLSADLPDLSPVRGAIRDFAPEAAIHLAWHGVGNTSRNDRAQLSNVAASLAFIEAAEEGGARAFVGLGSQAEYGPCSGAIAEDHPTRPTTLYGAAKLATQILAAGLCSQAGLRFAWVRLFSCYGPMDAPGWVIPYVTLELLRGRRPALTAGTQAWDFVHAADAAEAICRAALSEAGAGVFNLGSGRARPLRSIIERLRDTIDPALPLGFGEVPFRPDQVMHLEARIDRLREVLGWEPAIALEDGLVETAEWFRRNLSRYGG